MIDPIMIWNIAQFIGFILLLRYMQVHIRDNTKSVEFIRMNIYSKEEVNQMIELKLEPHVVELLNVRKDLAEIKVMLGKLLDAKLK